MGQPNSSLEIAATSPELGVALAADIRRLALEHNVYRGQVVSFGHRLAASQAFEPPSLAM